ncbi:ISAs1 family transposase [Pseudocolwellia sp. HL-MZ7]|uniref:ISAs1 family transposase n=1 Tax=Pseudocolwellia sp. HL-MZ7 TaxID=3400627 RepID=UPI003CEA47DB
MENNFIHHFSSITDPRESNKRHQLIDILFLAVSSVLSGAEGWEDIEDFGQAKLDWLREFLPFKYGIPSHDTIARVLSRLEPASIQQCFINWVKEVAEQVNADVIAIDGKVARRSFTTKDRKNALHMVSAWSCEHGLVLGQQKVEGKSNEITAIPKLLELLDVKGSVLTMDAMGCQHKITKLITEKEEDYVISLKGNQGTLNKEVQAWFQKAWREKYQDIRHSSYEHTDAGHGRIEVRKCLQLEIPNGWLTSAQNWSSIHSVVCVESTRIIGDKKTKENRYFISSLGINAQRASDVIRKHWQVENSLHWTLDMTFKEDDSRIRRGDGAEVMNAFRKLALNIVRNDNTRNASMKRKLKMAALDDKYRTKLLKGKS